MKAVSWIALVLSVLAIALGAYALALSFQRTESSSTVTNSQAAVPQNTVSENETANVTNETSNKPSADEQDMLSYCDDTFSFSIDYPESWGEPDTTPVEPNLLGDDSRSVKFGATDDFESLTITINPTPVGLGLLEEETIRTSTITVAGQSVDVQYAQLRDQATYQGLAKFEFGGDSYVVYGIFADASQAESGDAAIERVLESWSTRC